jgi:hypothetical protein
MARIRCFALAALVLLFPAPCSLFSQQTPQVSEIMARVAANQDRAQGLRTAFVYSQNLLLRFKRGNGKVAREEIRDYVVAPGEKGTAKKLVRFEGRYEKDGKLNSYDTPGFTCKDLDLDGELMEDFADDLAGDKETRDGIAKGLFPLTSRDLPKYRFTLKGSGEFRGRPVFKIAFEPTKHSWDGDDGTPWSGEVFVDREEFQPVYVNSRLTKGLPVAVRTLLGTNLRGLGFQVTYGRFEEGIWFPVSYGAEFELKAVFFYKRLIAISMLNRGFQRAHVAATVTFGEAATLTPVPILPEIPLLPLIPRH